MAAKSQTPFILIQAPAGYGKSVSIAQWFKEKHRSGKSVFWLSLDTLDNNLKRLLLHLIACLSDSDRNFGKSIRGQLKVDGKLSLPALVTTLLNEIAHIDESVYIVLDDFHLIDNKKVIKFFELLLENPPANLSFIFLSRKELPFADSRMKAAGQLVEFSANDLRFETDEIEQFFKLENGLDLSQEALQSLAKGTEGWIAGIKLTSLSMTENSNASDLNSLSSTSTDDVANFLAEEVLAKQPADIQKFLMKTSVLERMSPDLCNHLLVRKDSHRILAKLEKAGLFVVALDRDRNWYRYHHLFSDFLVRHLRSEKPLVESKLYSAASAWFKSHKLIDEAIRYSILAGDINGAIDLLDTASSQMFYDGRLSSIEYWVEEIGESHLRNHPNLLLNYAWVLILKWRFLHAGKLLDIIQENLAALRKDGDQSEEEKQLEYLLFHRKMMLGQFSDDMAETKRICDHLLTRNDVQDSYLQGNVYTSLIYAEREFLNISNFEDYSHKALELYEAIGSTFVLIWHGALAGSTAYLAGDIEKASYTLSEAWRNAFSISGEVSPLAAIPALLLAEVEFEQNDIQTANKLLERYLPLSEEIGFIDQIIAGLVTKSRILSQQSQFSEAKKALHHGEQMAMAHDFLRLKVAVYAEFIRIASVEGDSKAAKKYAKQLEKIISQADCKPAQNSRSTHAIAALAYCRFLRLNGNYAESIALAKPWARLCLHRGIFKMYVEFSATQITTFQAQGEERAAMRLVRQVLENIEGRKLVNSFLGDGPVVERMLVSMKAQDDNFKSEYPNLSSSILSTAKQSDQRLVKEYSKIPSLVEPLNKQEISILKWIYGGSSNNEIATKLSVTEGTVKWYIQCIYNKLGVRKRGKAAMLAKDLGFFG